MDRDNFQMKISDLEITDNFEYFSVLKTQTWDLWRNHALAPHLTELSPFKNVLPKLVKQLEFSMLSAWI